MKCTREPYAKWRGGLQLAREINRRRTQRESYGGPFANAPKRPLPHKRHTLRKGFTVADRQQQCTLRAPREAQWQPYLVDANGIFKWIILETTTLREERNSDIKWRRRFRQLQLTLWEIQTEDSWPGHSTAWMNSTSWLVELRQMRDDWRKRRVALLCSHLPNSFKAVACRGVQSKLD